MEFKTRTNQPSTQPKQKSQPVQTVPPNTLPSTVKRSFHLQGRRGKGLAIAGVILLVLLIIGILWAKKSFFSAEAAIQRDKFQAVFLTNGQVYFGHLADIEADYTKVTDVFYLQTQQSQTETASKDQQPQVTLTKLGSSELHGPEDTMYIAKNQILFWENLKDDGKVVQAIKDSQKK